MSACYISHIHEATLKTRELFGCLFLGEDCFIKEMHARVERFRRGNLMNDGPENLVGCRINTNELRDKETNKHKVG